MTDQYRPVDLPSTHAIRLIREDERECCAKIAEDWRFSCEDIVRDLEIDIEIGEAIAAAIRAMEDDNG